MVILLMRSMTVVSVVDIHSDQDSWLKLNSNWIGRILLAVQAVQREWLFPGESYRILSSWMDGLQL